VTNTATFPVYRGPAVAASSVRLLRGQVVVREESGHYSSVHGLWTPPGERKKEEARIGTVLALGPPAFLDYSGRCVEVPYLFDVGDRIVFAWVSNPFHFTLPWPPDGKPASWVPQGAVLGVLE
jgi:co-chaperonin GroES (HSP10)